MTLGLFAIAEMFYLYHARPDDREEEHINVQSSPGNRVWDGVLDTFRRFRIVVESAFIGAFVGIVPGMGGTVAMLFSYARAKQISKSPENLRARQYRGASCA